MRGQSLAEYSLVLAFVIGAVMIGAAYFKPRLVAVFQRETDNYVAAAGGAAQGAAINRISDSESRSLSDMTTSDTGTVTSDSRSLTTSGF